MTTSCKKLYELLSPERIVDLETTDKTEAMRILSDTVGRDGRVASPRALFEAMMAREAISSTAIGMGVAIPHVKIAEVRDYVAAVGRARGGIAFDACDGEPVHLIFMIAASARQTREFVRVLAGVTRLIKDEASRRELLEAPTAAEFLERMRAMES